MNKLWNVTESYTVIHTYDIKAETSEDAEDKLQSYIACNLYIEDVEHIPSLDDTDDYHIECIEEVKD